MSIVFAVVVGIYEDDDIGGKLQLGTNTSTVLV